MESARPAAPVAPPSLQARKIPENPFRCDRLIKYRGKTLPCDSALRRDGDGLRSILESNPDALAELEKYQAGRRSVQFAAYSGTAGLVIALTSGILTNLFIGKERAIARRDVAKVLRWGGATATVGSVAFGLSVLRSNEEHLQQAILKHNAAQPDRPIEILFKAEF